MNVGLDKRRLGNPGSIRLRSACTVFAYNKEEEKEN